MDFPQVQYPDLMLYWATVKHVGKKIYLILIGMGVGPKEPTCSEKLLSQRSME
jgi:hypothetical protein